MVGTFMAPMTMMNAKGAANLQHMQAIGESDRARILEYESASVGVTNTLPRSMGGPLEDVEPSRDAVHHHPELRFRAVAAVDDPNGLENEGVIQHLER